MRNGLQQVGSVMAMNGIRANQVTRGSEYQFGKLLSFRRGAWISEAVKLLSAMLYVDMTTAGDWARLASSLPAMTWISTWHGSIAWIGSSSLQNFAIVAVFCA